MKTLLPPLLFLLFLTSPIHAESDGATSHFDGRYRFAGGSAETHRLRSTIDELVSRFNPLLRGLARRRLVKTTRIPNSVRIASKKGTVLVDVTGAPSLGGEVVYEAGSLVQRRSNFEGARTTRFELSKDGLRLTMSVTTSSALLPDDLRYQFTFVRDADTLVGSASESGSGS